MPDDDGELARYSHGRDVIADHALVRSSGKSSVTVAGH
jgi:hypothetical protein